MNERMFEEIAMSFKAGHIETRRCDDQFVGTVQVIDNSTRFHDDGKTDFAMRISLKAWDRPNVPVIILILESPHTAEYEYLTPMPAAGDGYGETGRGLRTLFHEACPVHLFLSNGDYPIVLMNAVQYQCSLGFKPKVFRNEVFLQCWDSFGEQDFESRLLSAYRNNDVVINCCTAAGPKRRRLREVVEASVCAVVGGSTLKIEHPSNWMREHNAAKIQNRFTNYEWKFVSKCTIGRRPKL